MNEYNFLLKVFYITESMSIIYSYTISKINWVIVTLLVILQCRLSFHLGCPCKSLVPITLLNIYLRFSQKRSNPLPSINLGVSFWNNVEMSGRNKT